MKLLTRPQDGAHLFEEDITHKLSHRHRLAMSLRAGIYLLERRHTTHQWHYQLEQRLNMAVIQSTKFVLGLHRQC